MSRNVQKQTASLHVLPLPRQGKSYVPTQRGLEPRRDKPTRFLGEPDNHSGIASWQGTKLLLWNKRESAPATNSKLAELAFSVDKCNAYNANGISLHSYCIFTHLQQRAMRCSISRSRVTKRLFYLEIECVRCDACWNVWACLWFLLRKSNSRNN